MISKKAAPHKAKQPGQTRNDVRRFLKPLFRAGDLFEIRVLEMWTEPSTNRKSSKLIARRFHRVEQPLETLVAEMKELNRKHAGNVCFGVCPRPHEGAGKKDDIRLARCLWADLDDCSVKKALKRVKKAGLPPATTVIDSGHGVHLYWVLDKPIDLKSNLAQFEAAMKAIAGAIGGDHVHNVDRLLRLPGFDNVKDVRNGAKPVPCAIVEIQSDRRYHLAVFEAWRLKRMDSSCIDPQPPADDLDTARVSVDDPALKGEIELRLKKLAEKPVGKRSEPDFGFLSFLKSKGFKKEAAWDIVKGTGKFKERGKKYFERTWGNAKSRPVPHCGSFADATGTYLKRETKDGTIDVRLANFSAKIVADILLDDGGESRREFAIEAHVKGKIHKCRIPASQFGDMKWIADALGANAVIEPGHHCREQFRAAIQYLSGKIKRLRRFTHTGWRTLNDKEVYLHAGGAIGAAGPVPGIKVALDGRMENFKLPEPPKGKPLRDAVVSLLRMRTAAPGPVGHCVLAAVCRAPIGATDFSMMITGPTGVGKTEMAALAQQAFGAQMTAENLPTSWNTTPNANEVLTHAAKDSLVVVDDFAPTGSSQDVQRQHREADRLLRAKANAAGRGRLRPDASSRPTKYPRALLLCTGEDTPNGESLRPRIFFLEATDSTVNWPTLTQCQREAAAGMYSQAMAAYVQWIASCRAKIRQDLKAFRLEYIAGKTDTDIHKRTAANEAELLFAFDLFLEFACEVGAVTTPRAQTIRETIRSIIGALSVSQAEPRRQSDPASRYIDLLNQAFASGKAHLVGVGQITPPLAWGWERSADSRKVAVNVPRGQMVGWYVSKTIGKTEYAEVFLLPAAAHAVVADLGQKSNDPFTVSQGALHKRLRDAGCLASTDPNRGRILVRRSYGGRQQNVLHLKLRAFGRRPKQEIGK